MENLTILKNIAKYAVPTTVSTFATIFSVLINLKILGTINANYLYILALYIPLNYYLISLYESFRASAIAISSIAQGVEDKEFLSSNIAILSLFVLFIFLISGLFFLFSQHAVVGLLHVNVIERFVFIQFSFYMILISIFICLSYIFVSTFYGIGRPKVGMGLTLASAVLNCLFTYVLGYYFHLQLLSYPLAIVISYFSVGFISIVLLSKMKVIRMGCVQIDKRQIQHVLVFLKKISLPVWITYLVLFCCLFVTNFILAHFGATVLTGFGIAYRIQSLVILPAVSLGTAIAVLVNRQLAEKMEEKAMKTLQLGIFSAVCMYAVVVLLIVVFKYFIVSSLTDQPAIVASTLDYFRYVGLSYIGLGPLVVYLVVLEQTGSGAKSLFINFFYLMLPTVVGGYFALHFSNFHILYALVATINILSLVLVGVSCFGRKTPIKNLIAVTQL